MQPAQIYKTVTYQQIEVCYSDELDGGGQTFGQDYIRLFSSRFGKIDRLYEWCAGPGFIGFSLLAHGLCSSLCLSDSNPAAVAACQETIRKNHLERYVTVYLSDCLDAIPLHEQWDMVVGNPPHFHTREVYPHFGSPRLYQDVDWQSHRKFYRQIKTHLQPEGQILLQEHSSFSSATTFRSMIDEGDLTFLGSLPYPIPSRIYYIWSAKKNKEQNDLANSILLKDGRI